MALLLCGIVCCLFSLCFYNLSFFLFFSDSFLYIVSFFLFFFIWVVS
jgi:hypothetical protein